MVKVTKIELEDGVELTLIDEIEDNGVVYYYLANEEESFNFRIRKLINNGTEDLICGLDSDEEFEKAMNLYNKKHRNDDL
jgi:hypothetical protein